MRPGEQVLLHQIDAGIGLSRYDTAPWSIARIAAESPRARSGTFTLEEVAHAAAREAERQLICDTLSTTKGNQSQVARALSTDNKTVHVEMKALGINARDLVP